MVKVDVPKKLYKQIESLVEESPEFDDVHEFVKFVLKEVLKEEEPKKEEKVYSEEEEEEVKDRLRALGYL